MSAASSTGKATRIEGSCTLAQMTIAIAVEAEPAAACLGLFGRASENDGDGSRFPRRGGDKSQPRIECGLCQGWSGRSLGWFIIGLRIGGCTKVQQFVPDDAASAAVLSTAQSHEWLLSALCGLARVATG